VIPKVVKVVTEKRTGKEKKLKMPENCPVCGSELVQSKDEVAIRCINLSCPAQVKGSIQHFASRSAMDIEGLGYVLVEQLVEKGLAKNFADIYSLKFDDLVNLERMGKKSSENLLNAIEKSKERGLAMLIFAIGIRHVGIKAARILASAFQTMDKLMSASFEDLESLEEIGPVIAESIVNFLKNRENRKVIENLKANGVKMKLMNKVRVETLLSGKIFVLTGGLKDYTRERAQELIESLGGRVTSSVSSKTDYVVYGENPGSKFEKAKALGVKLINEEKFRKMTANR